MNIALSPLEIDALAEAVVGKLLARMESKPAVAPLLTERQVAEIAHVGVHTVKDARRKGKLRCTRIGRYPRFAAEDVRSWMEDRKSAG